MKRLAVDMVPGRALWKLSAGISCRGMERQVEWLKLLEMGIGIESKENLAQESSAPDPELASTKIGYRSKGIQAREFMRNHN